MDVSYHKDFSKNYVVFDEDQWKKEEDFCYQMLSYNKIEGILSVEKRMIDNRVQLYYDITGKQSLLSWMERSIYDYEKIKQLYKDFIFIIEESRRYLLYEDCFILNIEYIYVDIFTGKPYLCYKFGYQNSIIEQINSLTEYFMNKINYSDKEMVYLIYQLHGVGKEQGLTLNHMKQLLYEENQGREDHKEGTRQSTDLKYNPKYDTDNDIRVTQNIPKPIQSFVGTYPQKVESEVEIYYYPMKIYLISAIIIVAAFGIVLYTLSSGFFYNSYGKRIDFVKIVAVFVVILSVGSYALTKVWSKRNRLTKIASKEEFIQATEDKGKIINQKREQISNELYLNKDIFFTDNNSDSRIHNRSITIDKNEVPYETAYQDENATCLLNDIVRKDILRLKSIGKERIDEIIISHTPFFIGKRKGNVDYWLDQEGVSRYHAKITHEEGDYYITDLNSMNGTYVNESSVGIYEKKKIAEGDMISIANCQYLCQ